MPDTRGIVRGRIVHVQMIVKPNWSLTAVHCDIIHESDFFDQF